jgi:predicted transglutaminase-like cysteine proteinase
MRNRKVLISAFIFCLSVAMVAAAGAQSTATSPSTPDTHAQGAPGTQAPPPAGPSSNSPGTENSGAQSGTAQGRSSTGQSASSNGPGSVEDELQLTPDQKQKIAVVVDDENKQIAAVRDDTSMTMQQKQQKAMQIRQEGSPKIKAILTPDQLQKLAVIQQRMRDQQQGAGQSAPQSGPQSPSAPQGQSTPQPGPQNPQH